MRNNLITVLVLFALGLGGWTVMKAFRPSPNEISLSDEPEEITYICTETGALSQGELQVTPAVNPATGRRTLMQALYCAKCRKWYRAPPAEMAERSPRGPACPVTGGPLTVTDEPPDDEI